MHNTTTKYILPLLDQVGEEITLRLAETMDLKNALQTSANN